MECFKQKCRSNGSRTITKPIYAGLIVLVLVDVPSTLSNTDVRLSYNQIYNNTNYAQIPKSIPTNSFNNYGSSISSFNSSSHTEDKTKENNEVFRFNDKYEINSKEGLLVGFAHDPFRQSIPEADYAKGVSCCKLHDECYENVYCPFYTVYFQPYYWKCYHGQPLCALENYQSRNKVVNSCAGRLCECDRRFAMCVRKYSCPRGRPLCKSSPLRLLQNILMLK